MKYLAAGTATGILAPGRASSAFAQKQRAHGDLHFGVQLNAFPIDPKNFQTFLDALTEVKRIGYEGFESGFRFVNGQFANAVAARRQIEQTGLNFFGIHIFLGTPMYDPATGIAPAALYQEVARGGAALGARHLVLSGAPASDEEMLKRKIEGLNTAGAFAKSVGLRAAYHNHWPEFESKIGEIEALYSRTDPNLVSFLLDAGHAYHGGANVPAFIRTHQHRIVAFHLRDYKDGRLVTLGTGTFPLKEVAATIKEIGWSGWVENEEEREDLSHNGAKVITGVSGHEGGLCVINRREFVVGATALGTLSSAGMIARSYAAVPGANDRVSLGVIGLGRRGLIVSNGFVQDPRVRIVALCDIYGAATAGYQARMKGHLEQPEVYVRYQELLARKDVDAVYIATPDHLHVMVASDALAAGKHVYLEKPTVHRWQDRIKLKEAYDRSGKVLQCGTQQRSGAHYSKAKEEFFDSGKLGKVVLVRAVWHNFPWQRRMLPDEAKPADLNWELFLGPAAKVPWQYARYTSWRSFPDYGAGVLADILTHWVDTAQWMLNDAKPLRAAALGGIYDLHGYFQNPDTCSAVLQYKDWNLNFESSILSIRDEHPTVFFEGTNGTLNLTRAGYTFTPNEGEPLIFNSKQDLEAAHTKNFIDAITTGSAVSAPLSAGLEATLPVQMSLKSYWSHKIATPEDLA
jgi:predicted dehydrogenase/sugar phosphate isomerase/epimerase